MRSCDRWTRTIDPGKGFDLTLPLDEVAEGDRAMDERRAMTLLRSQHPANGRGTMMQRRKLGNSGL